MEIRLHGTVLYNSIYRADDQLLVNTHIYGVMANNAPVFHLRKIPGGEMASTYLESFERVWDGATPVRRGPASSGRRIDYYDDPAAPKANSLVPSVNVVVANDAGEVLLIRRSDNDNWAVPGGAIDLGESMVQAAIRETLEETGIECRITGTGRDLHRPEARDLVHQQRGGPAGVLDRADRGSRSAASRRRAVRAARCGGCRGTSSAGIRWTGRCGCGSGTTSTGRAAPYLG